jgi:hypothetical protein
MKDFGRNLFSASKQVTLWMAKTSAAMLAMQFRHLALSLTSLSLSLLLRAFQTLPAYIFNTAAIENQSRSTPPTTARATMSKPTVQQVIENVLRCIAPCSGLLRLLGVKDVAQTLSVQRAELYRALSALLSRATVYGAETELNYLLNSKIEADSTLNFAVQLMAMPNQMDQRVAELLAELDRVNWASVEPRMHVAVLFETMGGSEWEVRKSEGVQKLNHPVMQCALQHVATKNKCKWIVTSRQGDDTDSPRYEHYLETWAVDVAIPANDVHFQNGIFTHLKFAK